MKAPSFRYSKQVRVIHLKNCYSNKVKIENINYPTVDKKLKNISEICNNELSFKQYQLQIKNNWENEFNNRNFISSSNFMKLLTIITSVLHFSLRVRWEVGIICIKFSARHSDFWKQDHLSSCSKDPNVEPSSNRRWRNSIFRLLNETSHRRERRKEMTRGRNRME